MSVASSRSLQAPGIGMHPCTSDAKARKSVQPQMSGVSPGCEDRLTSSPASRKLVTVPTEKILKSLNDPVAAVIGSQVITASRSLGCPERHEQSLVHCSGKLWSSTRQTKPCIRNLVRARRDRLDGLIGKRMCWHPLQRWVREVATASQQHECPDFGLDGYSKMLPNDLMKTSNFYAKSCSLSEDCSEG